MSDLPPQPQSPLRIERVFAAPADRVFACFSSPADLKTWAWGDLSDDVAVEIDFRVGGRYRITTSRPDGQRWAFSGTYLEIVPDRRLAFTVHWDAPMGYEAPDEKVTVELAETEGTTRMIFLHEGVPGAEARQEHRRGWNNTLDVLSGLL